jgi:glycosyltransferase involved in cell wall biosynthesis
MVILEAMQHRVPVIYPAESGAAEVLQSGIQVPGASMQNTMANHVSKLISDLESWESTVREEAKEIDAYPTRGYEDLAIKVWSEAVARHPKEARA